MAAITAALVNELRSKTGQAMMECKKMLTETGGDLELAVRKFREKGVKGSIAERAATEGRVAVSVAADHRSAAAVQLNSNTDFTAKSDVVAAMATKYAAKYAAHPAHDLAADAELKAELTAASQQTGENVVLGKSAAVTGDYVGAYLYETAGKGKTAVLVSLAKADDELVRLIGMHVVATRPIALTRDQVPEELVKTEREIAIEQAKATGKPQQIAEKIAEGKMSSFYAERVLIDQDFVNPEAFKGKVADLLKSRGTTISQFVRIEVGQA